MKKLSDKETKKGYPVMPYLVGLFITVIILVLLSYLVQLRNRNELNTFNEPQTAMSESFVTEL